jgi:hypothetical protein
VSTLKTTATPASAPPGVIVDLSTNSGLTATVTVERSADNGITWQTIQGAAGVSVVVGMTWEDYAVPLGVPVIYRAQVSWASSTPETLTAAITVNRPGEIWLLDPLDASTALRLSTAGGAGPVITNASFREVVYQISGETVPVEGSTYPVASVGTRSALVSGVLALSAANTDFNKVRSLFLTAGLLVLRGLSDPMLPASAWLLPGDARETVAGMKRDWRTMSVECQLVQPVAAAIASAWVTWGDTVDALPNLPGAPRTWGEVRAAAPAENLTWASSVAWFARRPIT